ncbi:MAG: hypothetical protein ABI091_18605, partial [Ferruginibacter sp.]
QIVTPAAQWKRKLFNGLAQVIIQSTGEPGTIIIRADGGKLKTGILQLNAVKGDKRPAVAEK